MSVSRIGPTSVARSAFGVHPVGMKNAVMMPHAMKAAMLGRIMFDRNDPNLCTPTRVRVTPEGVLADVVVMVVTLLLLGCCVLGGRVRKG